MGIVFLTVAACSLCRAQYQDPSWIIGMGGQGWGSMDAAIASAQSAAAMATPEARAAEAQYWQSQADKMVDIAEDVGIYAAAFIVAAIEIIEIMEGGPLDPPELHFENPDTADRMVGFDFYDMPTLDSSGNFNFDNWNNDWISEIENEA
jgi:hypothetical protein